MIESGLRWIAMDRLVNEAAVHVLREVYRCEPERLSALGAVEDDEAASW